MRLQIWCSEVIRECRLCFESQTPHGCVICELDNDVAAREPLLERSHEERTEQTLVMARAFLGKRAESTCMGTIKVLENRRKSVI